MDNWYTSLPLLSELRKLNIGGCGTCTTNSPNYPSSLNVVKTIKMAYQQRSGHVQDGVATLLWMDNGPVKMMTTIHPLTGEGASVLKSKKRPGLKSTNATGIEQSGLFKDGEWEAEIPIPSCIDAYNCHMGGVDIADQLRASYPTHMTS